MVKVKHHKFPFWRPISSAPIVNFEEKQAKLKLEYILNILLTEKNNFQGSFQEVGLNGSQKKKKSKSTTSQTAHVQDYRMNSIIFDRPVRNYSTLRRILQNIEECYRNILEQKSARNANQIRNIRFDVRSSINTKSRKSCLNSYCLHSGHATAELWCNVTSSVIT